MILGFSDATIRVVKAGEGVREQGELCQHLGESLAPKIHILLINGYEMEMLERPERLTWDILMSAHSILQVEVWSRPARDPHADWLEELLGWAHHHNFPWIGKTIYDIYGKTEPEDGYCLIHGDPTLANVLMRNGRTILSDPMPRLRYRWEIPSRREVDLGKLLQSALGWEQQLGIVGCDWQGRAAGHRFVQSLKQRDRPLALIWASIHLARVSRRAPAKGRTDIAVWAEAESVRLAKLARSY